MVVNCMNAIVHDSWCAVRWADPAIFANDVQFDADNVHISGAAFAVGGRNSGRAEKTSAPVAARPTPRTMVRYQKNGELISRPRFGGLLLSPTGVDGTP